MWVVELVARVLGGVLLLVWLVCLPFTRRACRQRGSLLHSTIFQFCILPFIVGVGLVISGNPLVLLVLPVCAVIAIFFQRFMAFIFPLCAGWAYGGLAYEAVSGGSKLRYYVSCVLGVLAMFVVCTLVFAIVTTPPRPGGR